MAYPAFYRDQSTPLTSLFVLSAFGFKAKTLILTNDDPGSANLVVFSYDGTTIHGKLKPGERLTYDKADTSGIYLKFEVAAPAYRVIAVE